MWLLPSSAQDCDQDADVFIAVPHAATNPETLMHYCWMAKSEEFNAWCAHKVDPDDTLGLCKEHREELLDGQVGTQNADLG